MTVKPYSETRDAGVPQKEELGLGDEEGPRSGLTAARRQGGRERQQPQVDGAAEK